MVLKKMPPFRTRRDCLKGHVGCLPALTKLRRAIWPRIRAEIAWQGAPFWPREIDGEEFIGELHGPCTGAQSVYYRHVWKAAGQTIFRNLERMSTPILQAGLRYPEFCKDFQADRSMKKPGISFTFVRDPLSRFFSGYAEIEHRLAAGFADYLHLQDDLQPFARGTRERGRAFLEAFLRNAINHDGHVKPQSEFLAALGNCGVATDFVGKTESFQQDWARLVASLGCPAAPFDGSLGLHPNDAHDKEALQRGIGFNFFKMNSSQDASQLDRQMHSMALTAALADGGSILPQRY
ncbi:unnamed protein product [Symbiodinium natans]|uniref:Sulfotransferase family protein n=1 Tax=Symbiodinium natans TaxID=878477 RepID=A0A812TK12_9DINO|nr:unnamed protein product [Symbiodinium natans]